MAYSILNSDGSSLTILVDGQVDKSSSSLDLVGKNVANYGQYLNNNLVRLLENFASDSNNSPRSPLTGQLWYDTTIGKLQVYDKGNFRSVSGALVSSASPNLLASGDFWWDSSKNQLNIFNLEQAYLIGPAFPKSVGSAGWVMPSDTIVSSTSSDSQEVILLENYGKPVGALSNSAFSLTSADSKIYFDSDTTSTLVAGLTILGDIKTTGQLTSNYLSAFVDITWLDVAGQTDVTTFIGYNVQNKKIADILTNMFPVAASTATNEVGVPLGADAKVMCKFTDPVQTPAYQFRRFKVVNRTGTGISWQPYEVYSNTGITAVSSITGYVNIIPLVVS
jgi:hypothetical protein